MPARSSGPGRQRGQARINDQVQRTSAASEDSAHGAVWDVSQTFANMIVPLPVQDFSVTNTTIST